MKALTIFAALSGAVALAGCSSTGQLDPQTSATIATAYNNICTWVPAAGPISATMNAKAQAAYAQAQTICAAGAPTNAIAAGIDILAIETAIAPYFTKK